MGIAIRKVLEQRRNDDATWTLMVEAEIGPTVVQRCRVTVPEMQLRQWSRRAGISRGRVGLTSSVLLNLPWVPIR
jgi:hypothetical protein